MGFIRRYILKRYLLKRLGVLFLILSLCFTTTGFTSIATYSNTRNTISSELKEGTEEEFNEEKEIRNIEERELANENFNYPEIASASNSSRIVNVVSTSEELEAALEMANDGDIIEFANDIHLTKKLYITKSLELKTVDSVDSITIYSNDNERHFIIIGGEIQLLVRNVIFDGNGLSGGIESHATHLVLSGSVIQNCVAPLGKTSNPDDNRNPIYSYGGGIDALGELTVINSIISQNSAFYGGGIYTDFDINVYQCKISKNEAGIGGGLIINHRAQRIIRNANIIDSNISQNKAILISPYTTGAGGGIVVGYFVSLTIDNSEVSYNYANRDGAGLSTFTMSVKISNSIFAYNIAKYSDDARANTVGGGVYLRGGTSLHSTSSDISNCKFIGNTAGIGGALYLGIMDSVYISDSEFIDNSATLLGGAIDIMNTNTNIINCNFTQNNASYGGGISVYLKEGISTQITSTKFWENIAEFYGGGIYIRDKNSNDEPIPFEDVITISNSQIINNTAESGGGIGYHDTLNGLEFIEISNNSIIKNNFATSAARMINQEDILTHNRLIDSSVTWTDGFDYIYNNLDVQYNKNVDSTIHKITIIESCEDVQETSSYSVVQNEKFQYHFTIPEGYKALIESSVDLNVDMDTNTLVIESVVSDAYIQITYVPIEDTHTVTLITNYLDGAKEDESISYRVKSGESFEQTYETLEGYEFAGVSIRTTYPLIDGDAKTVYIDSVNEDFTITIKLARTNYNVKITTHYLDGILPDETIVYSVLHGDNFAESYEALEGYTFAGLNIRSLVYVDGDSQMVHIDEVKEDYHIIIRLDKAEYNVTITVQYPDGTINNQVSTYSVLYGDSFMEFFEIEDGYRAAAVQAEKGVDVDLLSQVIAIERVIKDIQITIICR